MSELHTIQQKLRRAWLELLPKVALAEVENDLRLLRLNKSTEAEKAIATFLTIPIDERKVVAEALVFVKSEEDPTSKGQRLARSFHNRMKSHSLMQLEIMGEHSLTGPEITTPIISPEDELSAILKRLENPVPKQEIRRLFLDKLRKEYESKTKSWGGGEYESITPIGNWRLITNFDFDGFFQFRPAFRITHDDLPERQSRGGATLGSLFGYGAEIGWDLVSQENLEESAEAAVTYCKAMRSLYVELTSLIERL